MDKQKEIKKIVGQIVERYNPEKIFLFGSFALGKNKENSDIDLLVIKKTKERFTRRLLEVSSVVSSSMGTDILVYTPKEWESAMEEENYFAREIVQTSKLIYDGKNKK